jgi:hypothetical protein
MQNNFEIKRMSHPCLSKQGILGSGTTCMQVPEANCNPWSGRSYACLSEEENFVIYLPTRFNKSCTQDVNSSNDAIKNLKFPVPWLNFIQQPTSLSA